MDGYYYYSVVVSPTGSGPSHFLFPNIDINTPVHVVDAFPNDHVVRYLMGSISSISANLILKFGCLLACIHLILWSVFSTLSLPF